MAGDWYVDKGLGVLMGQVRRDNPGMSIGTIASNEHHQANPDSDHDPEADGSVDAADFMIGSVFTKTDARKLADALVKFKDPRISYVIYDHKIVSGHVVGSTPAWKWRTYNGNDPHTNHVHVSVNDLHENDTSIWVLSNPVIPKEETLRVTGEWPIVGQGSDDNKRDGYDIVRRIQKQAGVTADGVWGTKTSQALGYTIMNAERYHNLFGLTIVN